MREEGNYIEVMNGEARQKNFPSVNDYRDPLVEAAMRVIKYVNKFNRGVTRVQEIPIHAKSEAKNIVPFFLRFMELYILFSIPSIIYALINLSHFMV